VSVPAGWYPNPTPDEASLAKGKFRYWDGSQWLPRYADVPPTAPVGKPEPKVLVSTSAEIVGMGPWKDVRGGRSLMGRAAVIEEGRTRRLEFVCDSGLRPLRGLGGQQAISRTDIVRIEKVKSALNTVVEIYYRGDNMEFARHTDPSVLDVLCLAGPRGRMQTVCAAVGHPI
jgi:hypothetical protein